MMNTDWKNKLYFGDNLDILREHVKGETADLIYLDPPFNSNATYNVLFGEKSGEKSVAQITAFEDTWHWGLESEKEYQEVVTSGPKKLGNLLQAFRSFLGPNDVMAYSGMMATPTITLTMCPISTRLNANRLKQGSWPPRRAVLTQGSQQACL